MSQSQQQQAPRSEDTGTAPSQPNQTAATPQNSQSSPSPSPPSQQSQAQNQNQNQNQGQSQRPRDESGRFTKPESGSTPAEQKNADDDFMHLDESTLSDSNAMLQKMLRMKEALARAEAEKEQERQEKETLKRKAEEENRVKEEERVKRLKKVAEESSEMMKSALNNWETASTHSKIVQPLDDGYKQAMESFPNEIAEAMLNAPKDPERIINLMGAVTRMISACSETVQRQAHDNAVLTSEITEQSEENIKEKLLQRYNSIAVGGVAASPVQPKPTTIASAPDTLAPPERRFEKMDFSRDNMFKSQGQMIPNPIQPAAAAAPPPAATPVATQASSERAQKQCNWDEYNSALPLLQANKANTYGELQKNMVILCGNANQRVASQASMGRAGAAGGVGARAGMLDLRAFENSATLDDSARSVLRSDYLPPRTPSACEKFVGGQQFDPMGIFSQMIGIAENANHSSKAAAKDAHEMAVKRAADHLRRRGQYTDADRLYRPSPVPTSTAVTN